jgi:CheY-like chemotaxis protein
MTGKTILIIDDDRHLLLGLAARLKGSGYKVVCAKDGTAGITLARQEGPDLVILDLGMPGDDGSWSLNECEKWHVSRQSQSSYSPPGLRLTMRNVRWTAGRWLSFRSLPVIINS